jgi:activating signal cointegrator 1
MIALSIRQPWAELILRGSKTIEVRGWATRHRGELWLHAAMRKDIPLLNRFNLGADDLTFGALVGVCELYDCIEFTDDTWDRLRIQHLNEGPLEKRHYAWLLRNPNRIKPKPLKGRLGLMRIND